VGMAGIRFKKRLDVTDFPLILNHFSIIAKREPTFAYTGPRKDLNRPSSSNAKETAQAEPIEEKDTDTHLNMLQRASADSSKRLDLKLPKSTLIFEALQNSPNNGGTRAATNTTRSSTRLVW